MAKSAYAVHSVYPSQKFVKPKLKAFNEMATKRLKEIFLNRLADEI